MYLFVFILHVLDNLPKLRRHRWWQRHCSCSPPVWQSTTSLIRWFDDLLEFHSRNYCIGVLEQEGGGSIRWAGISRIMTSLGIFTFDEQEDCWCTGKWSQRRGIHNGALTSIHAVTAGVDPCEREVEGVVFGPFVFHTHCVGTRVTVGRV